MSAARVILVTVAGPGGHMDVGVRSDATPGELADTLGTVIGVSPAATVIEHRSPPRPGVPDGGRVLVGSTTPLAEAGVADGDLLLFRTAGGGGGYSWPEVQARPADFGADAPPPRAAPLRLPPVSQPLAPVRAAAAAPAAEAWAPAATRSDEWSAASLAAGGDGAAGPAATTPDLLVRRPSATDPAAARPDVWTPAAPESPSATGDRWILPAESDVWSAADQRPPEAWTEAESGPSDAPLSAATTQADIGQPTAGRHARSQTAAGEPEPEAGLDIAQSWRADAPGPPEQDPGVVARQQGGEPR